MPSRPFLQSLKRTKHSVSAKASYLSDRGMTCGACAFVASASLRADRHECNEMAAYYNTTTPENDTPVMAEMVTSTHTA